MKVEEQDRGKEIREVLHNVLKSDNSLSRCHGVNALARIGADDKKTVKLLIGLLLDEDPDVRMDAAAALGKLKAGGAVKDLFKNIEGDPEGDVRIQAVEAITAIGAGETVEPLIKCLKEDGYPELDMIVDDHEFAACWEVQARALEALGVIGDGRAAEPIIEFLLSEDHEDLQESGFMVLAKLDSDLARDFLLTRLAKGSRLAKRRSIRALAAQIGGREFPAEVMEGMTDALLDKDAQVRITAARALGGTGSPLVATPLIMLLGDKNPQVRKEIAAVLGKIKGSAVVERLHEMLDEPEIETRCGIIRVIGDIGDPASYEYLAPMLSSEDEKLLYDVIVALGKIGQPGVEARLAIILADGNNHYTMRTKAAQALGRIFKNTPSEDLDDDIQARVLNILREAAFDDKELVAFTALSALADIDSEAACDLLTGLLQGEIRQTVKEDENEQEIAQEPSGDLTRMIDMDPENSTLSSILAGAEKENMEEQETKSPLMRKKRTNPAESVKIHAARLLGGMPEPGEAAIEALIGAAGSGSRDLAREALLALGRIGDEKAFDVIFQAFEAENMEVRLAALDAAGGFDIKHISKDKLDKLLNDPDTTIRERAVRSLLCGKGLADGQYLAAALADKEISVCRAALEAAQKGFSDEDAGTRLFELMFRFSGNFHKQAAAALGAAGDFSRWPDLMGTLKDEGREEYHWICIDALSEMYICAKGEMA